MPLTLTFHPLRRRNLSRMGSKLLSSGLDGEEIFPSSNITWDDEGRILAMQVGGKDLGQQSRIIWINECSVLLRSYETCCRLRL